MLNEAPAAEQPSLGTEEVLGNSTQDPSQASGTDESGNADPLDTPQDEKQLSSFARRIQKIERNIAAQYEGTKQELEYWKAQALQKADPVQPTKQRLDFASDEEWFEHRLKLERDTLSKEAQQVATETLKIERVVQGYQQRVTEAKKELPDWDTVFTNAQEEGTTLPQEAIEFCLESESGARIAYHLAKNSSEYERFMKLSPTRRIAELGKLEDKLSKPAAPRSNTVTKAPAKLAEVKTGTTLKTSPTGPDRFANKAAWKEWRATQGKR